MAEQVVPDVAPLGGRSPLVRWLGLAYGIVGYVLAIGFWPLFIVFIGNLPRPSEPVLGYSVSYAPVIRPATEAFLVNLLLIAAFGLQHSFLARPAVKRVWTRYIAEPFQRSTFVHIANIFAFAIVLHWQPIPIVLWRFSEHDLLARALVLVPFFLGWLLLLLGAMSFNLQALFGLRQIVAWYHGRPYEPIDVRQSWSYRFARHPEFLGVFLGLWMTTEMTVGHLQLAGALTLYSLIALRYRERELERMPKLEYARYRAEVPMLGPRWMVWPCAAVFVIASGLALVNSQQEKARDGAKVAQIAAIQAALINYRKQHGAFPDNPGPGHLACSGGEKAALYDAVIDRLDPQREAGPPLARPRTDQLSGAICYYSYGPGNALGAVIGTRLETSAFSNTGLAGSCRPSTANKWCEARPASRIHCLCQPH